MSAMELGGFLCGFSLVEWKKRRGGEKCGPGGIRMEERLLQPGIK
jgi:hypothetical protein